MHNDLDSIADYVFLVNDIVIILLSAIVLVLACIRRISDVTVLLIPTLFIVAAGIVIPTDIQGYETDKYVGDNWKHQPIKLVQRFIFNFSHWLFVSQYLKTSLIFPRLFT